MNPVQKALWYVENHSREALTLDDIADACSVSAFHLTRAFSATTGRSLMRYVRARRLSEAARQLAEGAADILSLALDSGYGSHEAFTRAFRDQFALTPEKVRTQGHLGNINLVEAITMKTTPIPAIASLRVATVEPMRFAGLIERHDCDSPAGIPNQWQRFMPYFATMPPHTDEATYGVIYNYDGDAYDYLCGVRIKGSPTLPKGIATLDVPAQLYAVFSHDGHVAAIGGTMSAILNGWFPESGYRPGEAPTLERYGSGFDPRTGLGDIQVWLPVAE